MIFKKVLFSHRHARCNPFKALKVLLVSEDRVNLWTSLLTMCGAAKVQHHKISNNSCGRFYLVHLKIFHLVCFAYFMMHNTASSCPNCIPSTHSRSLVLIWELQLQKSFVLVCRSFTREVRLDGVRVPVSCRGAEVCDGHQHPCGVFRVAGSVCDLRRTSGLRRSAWVSSWLLVLRFVSSVFF